MKTNRFSKRIDRVEMALAKARGGPAMLDEPGRQATLEVMKCPEAYTLVLDAAERYRYGGHGIADFKEWMAADGVGRALVEQAAALLEVTQQAGGA